MKIKHASRIGLVPPYLFVEVRKKISEAEAKGIDVISFAVGDPVESTPREIIETLKKESENKSNHCYPPGEASGMPSFRRAVAEWYGSRFGVNLDPETEVLALIGSKEGSHHLALSLINPANNFTVTDSHTYAPTGHIKRFGE